MIRFTCQARFIKRVFSELTEDQVEKYDAFIKSRIISCSNAEIVKDITKDFVVMIEPNLLDTDHQIVENKCRRIVNSYMLDDRLFILQENWFCLLAFLIAIVSMICRIVEFSTEINDKTAYTSYFIALIIWFCFVTTKRFMNETTYLFLSCFNRCAPLITIIMGAVFYKCILCSFPEWVLWLIPSISLVMTFVFTIYRFQKTKHPFEG